MCRGGGGGTNLHYLLCLISNTATVGTIFLASTTVLRHRLLLQTTCYNHLHLLLHLHSSRKEKQKQQQARYPPPPPSPTPWGGGGGGVRIQKGLRPFNPLQKSDENI